MHPRRKERLQCHFKIICSKGHPLVKLERGRLLLFCRIIPVYGVYPFLYTGFSVAKYRGITIYGIFFILSV
ncbi:hypothetical protein D9M68_698180 [compost metagenome]